MRFLAHRLVIFLAVLGLLVSLLLGLISRAAIGMLLVRALVSGFGMGFLGWVLLVVLERVLPHQDFEDILALFEGKAVVSRDEQVRNDDSAAFSFEGQDDAGGEATPPPSRSTLNVVEDSDTWSMMGGDKETEAFGRSEANKKTEAGVFNPATAVFDGTDDEMGTVAPSAPPVEQFQQLRTEYEREKPSFADNTVSFKVNDKKINTSPDIVAKAIKTILSKDS